MSVDEEIDAGARTFQTGLLLELIAAMRRTRPGDLIAVVASSEIAPDLESWSRLTGHAIVDAVPGDAGTTRWIIRHGQIAVSAEPEPERPLGSRLWLYTNFDCNLQCGYCCVRSSPRAPRRTLDLALVRTIASEAPRLGVEDIFLTGGEPFLRPDIADVANACAAAASTTLLTNGMLFKGTRLSVLRAIDRHVTLQISLDSPEPGAHDAMRGAGAWQRAVDGIAIAKQEGFRVRIASTVDSDEAARAMTTFLDAQAIPHADRVIRPVVRRGFAVKGTALGRMDLVPEITITAEGVFWHPVGADDEDLLVTREILPLAAAFAAAAAAATREREHATRLASVFHCA